MITLDDFDYYDCGLYRKGNNFSGPLVNIWLCVSESRYKWYIKDEREYDLICNIGCRSYQTALDDLLACDNPIAVRALREVFGDKYEEPNT